MSHSTSSNVVFLQNALKNLEERYKKLQSRTDSLQTENERLVASRTELVNEVERLQDQQIRLRERNLRLTQEFHAKQQECSLLAEKLTMFARGRVANYRENTESFKSDSSELREDLEKLKDSLVTVELHGSVTSPSTLKILEVTSRAYSEPNLSIIQRELDLVRKGLWSPAFENAKLAAVEELCSKSNTTSSRNPSSFDSQFPDQLKAGLKPLETASSELSNVSVKTDVSSLDPVDKLNNCVQASNMILNNLKGQNSRLLKVQQILKMAAASEPVSTSVVTQTSFDMHAPDLSNNSVWKNMQTDRVCPLCDNIFSTVISQDEFVDHVMSHFNGEESITPDFEILSS